jgi:gamma-glutamyl:cysteine ligase YbdK (ATP-grasp superfamily)
MAVGHASTATRSSDEWDWRMGAGARKVAAMGTDVDRTEFSRADRARFRAKVRDCLDTFTRMLSECRFDACSQVGLEIELNLVEDTGRPAMRNEPVLLAISDPTFQTELGQFNIEVNVAHRAFTGSALAGLERDVRESLNAAEVKANAEGARIIMVGILPTLSVHDLSGDWLSPNPRYALLNEQILAQRGEDVVLDIEGPEEELQGTWDTIAPESGCTSVQYHLQVDPTDFPRYWNASQAIAGVQVALAANSPYLFGRHLWAETRIALFEQATDTRSDELKTQGVRPRVWFGERWITSIFDLFEENSRYFAPLLPVLDDEQPMAILAAGGIPVLPELRLHNGTIYRWNRPVYDIANGQPHLRVENRVLPAGPTVLDIVANGAFYSGLVRALADADRPVWTQMSFAAAKDNLTAGARDGLDATVFWPGLGDVGVSELTLRRLLPLAREGLQAQGIDAADIDRLLGVIADRCRTMRNGATWQVDTVREMEAGGLDRAEALRAMTLLYATHMHRNEPVHSWPVGA